MTKSISASLPEVVPNQVRLTQQVRLCYLPMEHCKGNYLSLRFLLPLGEMTSTCALLPYVLSRGSNEYPDIDAIDRAADLLYGAEISPMVGSEGEWQVIGFSASFLADRMAPDGCEILDGVLHLLSSLLLSPRTEGATLLPEYVESEKVKLCDRLRSLKDNPDLYAIKRSEELMCAGESYALYERGEESQVAAVTPEALTGAWQNLLSTAPLCITYAGDCALERLKPLLLSRFGRLTATPAPLPPTEVIRQAKGELRRFTEKLPTGQCQLIIGLRSGSVIGDEDHAAFSLLYAMLSSAPTARLFTKVREERSLCYSCSALSDSHKGILLITCGLRRERLQEAEDAIFDQLRALARGDFTDEEFESAKRWLMGRYPILEDSPIALAGWYFSRSPLGLAESPRTEAERIRRVTRADVMHAAGRLSPDTVYTLLDRSRTRKEVSHEN
ncbi:MAG: insulinase family protein [Clostridia bacterium]|nr:insulinase family protein [Clostridia bacterium]